MAHFTEGVHVQYKHHTGVITFVSDHYLSIMIRKFPKEPVRNVKLVVHRSEWKDIKLIKESDK